MPSALFEIWALNSPSLRLIVCILRSGLKHIPFLRYTDTESNHRSPPVHVVAPAVCFLSAAQAPCFCGLVCGCASAVPHYSAVWRLLKMHLIENDAATLSLKGFCQLCSVCSCSYSVLKGEEVNPPKELKKLFLSAALH